MKFEVGSLMQSEVDGKKCVKIRSKEWQMKLAVSSMSKSLIARLPMAL